MVHPWCVQDGRHPRWREAPFEGGHTARDRVVGEHHHHAAFCAIRRGLRVSRIRVVYLVPRPDVSQRRREIPRDFSFNIHRGGKARGARRARRVLSPVSPDLAYPRRGSTTRDRRRAPGCRGWQDVKRGKPCLALGDRSQTTPAMARISPAERSAEPPRFPSLAVLGPPARNSETRAPITYRIVFARSYFNQRTRAHGETEARTCARRAGRALNDRRSGRSSSAPIRNRTPVLRRT